VYLHQEYSAARRKFEAAKEKYENEQNELKVEQESPSTCRCTQMTLIITSHSPLKAVLDARSTHYGKLFGQELPPGKPGKGGKKEGCAQQ